MVTEDEMVGWHHCLNGHESEQTLGDSGGEKSLAAIVHGVERVRCDLATEQGQLFANHGASIVSPNLSTSLPGM